MELQSYREDNERMIKSQEEKNQLNASMLGKLTDIQRNMNYGHRAVNLEGSRSGARRRKSSSSGSSYSEGSNGGSISSSHKNKTERR